MLDGEREVARVLRTTPHASTTRSLEDELIVSIPHWLYREDTPLHLATVIVLGKEYPELRRQSLRAARSMLNTLLGAGANPSARNQKGQTPADAARERGAPTLAALLDGRIRGRL